jgi:hypothetical protein
MFVIIYGSLNYFHIVVLQALSNEANELLPVFNKTSTKHYRATVPTADWSNASSCMGIRHMTTTNPRRQTTKQNETMHAQC